MFDICGLKVSSDVDLGLDAGDDAGAPDVTIRLGEAPESIADATFRSAWFDARAARLLLRSGAWGRYAIEDGTTILATPAAETTLAALRLALLGPCFGAILQQRGVPCLHASVVRAGDGCVAIAGPSGRGKSTLGAAIDRLGSTLVGDDVTAIAFDGARAFAFPAPGSLKLWPDSADALGESGATFMADHAKREIKSPRVERLVLRAIYVLEDGDPGDEVAFTAIPRGEAAALVAQNLYRPEWLVPMGIGARAFLGAAEIARRAEVIRLRRPRDLSRIAEVARALIARHP